MGQCVASRSALFELFEFDFDAGPESISLDLARSRSSNPVVTSLRYHVQGQGRNKKGRSLHDDYDVYAATVLGTGLCGNVVLAKGKVDNRRYALKSIGKTALMARKRNKLLSEVEIYLTLDHPNIARLHDVYESDSQISLITECCEGGELYHRLEEKIVFSDAEAAIASRQMLRAIGYLHAHQVVHRDVKLENFLFDKPGDLSAGSQLKLIDFGFAKIWDESTMMTASCGSVNYVSPDVLSHKGYTNKCDMWSIGVVVWMMLVGYPPFHGDEQGIMRSIKAGALDWRHQSRWGNVRDEAVDFVKSLLVVNPDCRPDAAEALRHPWLARGGGKDGQVVLLGRGVLRSLESYSKAPKVSQVALQLLVQELDPDELQELRDLFVALNKSNSGSISIRELKDAIRGVDESASEAGSPTSAPMPQRIRPETSDLLDEVLSAMNKSGTERIYFSEFLAATLAPSAIQEEKLRAVFRRFDVQDSGVISVASLRALFGDAAGGYEAEQLISKVDSTGKGELDFESFRQVLSASRADIGISPVSRVSRVWAL